MRGVYGTIASPLGELCAATFGDGLAWLSLPATSHADALADLAARLDCDLRRDDAALAPVRDQLDSYFAGERRVFELEIDGRLMGSGFTRRALDAMFAIPYGETVSYAELAAAAGSPRATRAAGTVCSSNPIPIVYPCHRVLASGGRLGGFGGGLAMKRTLLRHEGARVGAEAAGQLALV